MGLLKFVQNSPIKPFETCCYCPTIISPGRWFVPLKSSSSMSRSDPQRRTALRSGPGRSIAPKGQCRNRAATWPQRSQHSPRGNVGTPSLHSPKGQCRRIVNEFQEAQDDQKNRLKTSLNHPQMDPKWCQNVTQGGSFHSTEDGVCGYLSDGVLWLDGPTSQYVRP